MNILKVGPRERAFAAFLKYVEDVDIINVRNMLSGPNNSLFLSLRKQYPEGLRSVEMQNGLSVTGIAVKTGNWDLVVLLVSKGAKITEAEIKMAEPGSNIREFLQTIHAIELRRK